MPAHEQTLTYTWKARILGHNSTSNAQLSKFLEEVCLSVGVWCASLTFVFTWTKRLDRHVFPVQDGTRLSFYPRHRVNSPGPCCWREKHPLRWWMIERAGREHYMKPASYRLANGMYVQTRNTEQRTWNASNSKNGKTRILNKTQGSNTALNSLYQIIFLLDTLTTTTHRKEPRFPPK